MHSSRKKIFACAKTLLQITIPLSCTHEYFCINLLLKFSSDVSSLGILWHNCEYIYANYVVISQILGVKQFLS